MALRALLAALLALVLWDAVRAAKVAAPGSSNPVSKVVTLLKEIAKEVEKESEDDEDTYKKYKCWCEENDKAKTASIASMKESLEDKEAFSLTGSAEVARLETQIGFESKELKQDRESLASAVAQRAKEKQAYETESSEASETLKAIKTALRALHGAQEKVEDVQESYRPGSTGRKALLQVHDTLEQHLPKFQGIMQKDLYDVLGSLEEAVQSGGAGEKAFLSPRRQGTALLQRSSEGYDPSAEYASSSGGIIGTLQSMSWKMDEDIAEAKKAEQEAVEDFKKLEVAKTAEIKAAEEQLEKKQVEMADMKEKVARAKAEISRLKQALAADEKFLAQLKQDCKAEAEDYEQRSKARQEEGLAVRETLEILLEDTARAHLAAAASFLQVEQVPHRSAAEEDKKHQALERLSEAARSTGSLSLLSLSMHTSLDEFTKVKEMMDKAVVHLKLQHTRDEDSLEKCKTDIDGSEDKLREAKKVEETAQHRNKGVKDTLDELTSDLKKLEEDISKSEASLQEAGLERKHANKLYQKSISDARLTVEILTKAEARLQAYYASPAFLQEEEPGMATRAEPAKSKDYQKSSGAGVVVQMLQKIIKEAELSAQTIELGEKRAEEVYARFVQEVGNSIEASKRAVFESKRQVAKVKSQKAKAAESLTSADAEVSKLEDLLKAQHAECDWLMKNFPERKKARDDELYAIRDAKAVLSGAK
eukprot:TRINITY_DN38416_c0_g2_i1.p1 TRINITY_DN38416_c0_g2~~TRINITY_DN38416_c0_g2_i1.p1  ORF type:complete len:707 (+),score=249.06 TRINITY_DN38416_c0_g2_i1:75-2195(+)